MKRGYKLKTQKLGEKNRRKNEEQKTMKLNAEKKIKNYKLKSLFFHKYL